MNCQLKTHDHKATWLVLFWEKEMIQAQYWCHTCVVTDISESTISMTNLEFGNAIEGIRNV